MNGVKVKVKQIPVPVEIPPPPVEEDERGSSWDPDPIANRIEVSRCRRFLLEIIRRAAHDFVLYRISRRLDKRSWANDAFTWLFEEDREHSHYKERAKDGRTLTSFIDICDVLDLDPDTVRERVLQMDVKTIMSAGRPAERRKRKKSTEVDCDTHGVVNIRLEDAEPGPNPYQHSSYESQFATNSLNTAYA
jgi:hypothetical protein